MIPVLGVPILARPELLYRFLRSVDHPVGHLVIVDNGGVVDEDLAWQSCEQAERVSVIHIPTGGNLGVAGSWNLIVKVTPKAPFWMIANFDIVCPPGTLRSMAEAAPHTGLVLCGETQAWCLFTVSAQAVDRLGLFDESYHPAYFEDDDYLRRAVCHGVSVARNLDAPVHHDNSSTLAAGYADANNLTFNLNAAYYQAKADRGDFTEGRWSLERRRMLSWD